MCFPDVSWSNHNRFTSKPGHLRSFGAKRNRTCFETSPSLKQQYQNEIKRSFEARVSAACHNLTFKIRINQFLISDRSRKQTEKMIGRLRRYWSPFNCESTLTGDYILCRTSFN